MGQHRPRCGSTKPLLYFGTTPGGEVMHRTRAVFGVAAAAVALAIGLAACGSSANHNTAQPVAATSAKPATAITSVAPKPKPSPTPTVWTSAEAGRQYLAMVAPGNAQIDVYRKMDTNNSTAAQVSAQLTVMAKADDTFARALSNGKWPAAVRPKIDALIDGLAEERAQLMSGAAQTTAYQMFAVANAPSTASAKAESVRIALNLPGTS